MKEFIALMAFLMAIIALSIDAMLPALSNISHDLNISSANDIQYVVSFVFVGMSISTIFYGPLSDAFGRRPILFTGLILFVIGSIISSNASNLTIMLLGRFVQGLGIGAPRIMTMAIVRDKFHGNKMASVMSLIMGFFILFPAIAPAIGQSILFISDWRGIFIFYIIISIIAFAWSYFRLKESLNKKKRRKLNINELLSGAKEIINTRATIGYTVCSGVVFGCLITYINTAQQIFIDIFKVGNLFALYFGLLTLSIGLAFFVNSFMVKRFGMRRITAYGLITVSLSAASLVISILLFGESLLLFMIFTSFIFFSLGLTFGNMGAMSLEPMGHIAGLASAFMGALSTIISVIIGIALGQLYDGTVIPLSSSFLALGVSGFLIMIWTERGFSFFKEKIN